MLNRHQIYADVTGQIASLALPRETLLVCAFVLEVEYIITDVFLAGIPFCKRNSGAKCNQSRSSEHAGIQRSLSWYKIQLRYDYCHHD
jgi:hypothetical protein